jgi:hypothetical protein
VSQFYPSKNWKRKYFKKTSIQQLSKRDKNYTGMLMAYPLLWTF